MWSRCARRCTNRSDRASHEGKTATGIHWQRLEEYNRVPAAARSGEKRPLVIFLVGARVVTGEASFPILIRTVKHAKIMSPDISPLSGVCLTGAATAAPGCRISFNLAARKMSAVGQLETSGSLRNMSAVRPKPEMIYNGYSKSFSSNSIDIHGF